MSNSRRGGGRAGRDIFRFAPNGIYGIIGSGHSRSSHRRCSATRSGTTSRASCPRWSRTAGRPRLSRVPSTRRRPSPSRPTDELRPLSPSSDHPPFNPNRRDVSRAGLLALSRIRAHELSRFPRLSDPRFPSLGGNELTGGSVRVDAARGSSRTKLPNLVVFAEARVARRCRREQPCGVCGGSPRRATEPRLAPGRDDVGVRRRRRGRAERSQRGGGHGQPRALPASPSPVDTRNGERRVKKNRKKRKSALSTVRSRDRSAPPREPTAKSRARGESSRLENGEPCFISLRFSDRNNLHLFSSGSRQVFSPKETVATVLARRTRQTTFLRSGIIIARRSAPPTRFATPVRPGAAGVT